MATKQTIQHVLNKWEAYTLTADACYHRGEYKEASRTFSRAVEVIEPWLEKDHKQLWRVMRLFVISCHNSAHSMSKFGHHKEAEYYYSHAHFRLLSLVNRQNHQCNVVEQVIIELRRTFFQLRDYLMAKNKKALADDIHEESLRVVRNSYLDHVGDVFKA